MTVRENTDSLSDESELDSVVESVELKLKHLPSEILEQVLFFTVLADEATDVSHTEQLCISIRFINQNCEINEEVLALYLANKQQVKLLQHRSLNPFKPGH